MTGLDAETIDKLLAEDEDKPKRSSGGSKKSHPWTCPKCKKWITNAEGAKFHVCKS